MIKFKILLGVWLILFASEVIAQTKDVSGQIVASGDLVGIHIINKTALKYTITDDNGTFVIPAKLNDTIVISGIQYKPKDIVITDIIMQTKSMTVNLEDHVNELDEVVVGKILTGDLLTDIENSDAKREINFYDLGIPGYTGPRMTQSERRVYEANSGGGILPLNPLINWITGRTKKLKEQVAREKRFQAMDEAKAKYTAMLFETESFDASQQTEFFHFASYDPDFVVFSKTKTEIEMFQFLKEKLKAFKLQIGDD